MQATLWISLRREFYHATTEKALSVIATNITSEVGETWTTPSQKILTGINWRNKDQAVTYGKRWSNRYQPGQLTQATF